MYFRNLHQQAVRYNISMDANTYEVEAKFYEDRACEIFEIAYQNNREKAFKGYPYIESRKIAVLRCKIYFL